MNQSSDGWKKLGREVWIGKRQQESWDFGYLPYRIAGATDIQGRIASVRETIPCILNSCREGDNSLYTKLMS